jgi:hypothetical protein
MRLEDRVAALRSRQKVDNDAHIEHVKSLAFVAKKARRACELAEWDWRQKPNADTLAAAMAAQHVRSAAEAELREICLHDEQLISDVKQRWGR